MGDNLAASVAFRIGPKMNAAYMKMNSMESRPTCITGRSILGWSLSQLEEHHHQAIGAKKSYVRSNKIIPDA